jgi:hypothetical protein
VALIPIALGLGLGAYRMATSPAFYVEVVPLIFRALLPAFLKVFAPKDFTPEQLGKIRRGEDPFNSRREH